MRPQMCSSRAVHVVFENRIGGMFRLALMTAWLDRERIYFRFNDGAESMEIPRDFVIYDGPLPDGPHSIELKLVYRMHGYGIFRYLEGYSVTLIKETRFRWARDSHLEIKAAAYEHSDLFPIEQRPWLEWQLTPAAACS